MLSAMTEGSLASSPITLSAGGQDEQPCEVKSSTTARGSAAAGRTMATIAQTPSALANREIKLQAIITAMLRPGNHYRHHSPLASNGSKSQGLSKQAGAA